MIKNSNPYYTKVAQSTRTVVAVCIRHGNTLEVCLRDLSAYCRTEASLTRATEYARIEYSHVAANKVGGK